MRWTRYVARKGGGRDTYRMLVGRPEGKKHFQELGIDGRIIPIKMDFQEA